MDISSGPVIAGIICAVAIFVSIIYAIVKGQRRKLTTGVEEMVGKIAVAQTPLNPKGTVLAEGELWTAISKDDKIEPGEEVIISKVEGLKLRVTKKV
jgi:membrane-bound serine protease (ClpP class)